MYDIYTNMDNIMIIDDTLLSPIEWKLGLSNYVVRTV